MAFTGKATYTAGSSLPEIAEDISDIVSVVSPFETPFLDYLGDAARPARSTVHEWLEDTLLPNTDQVNQTTFTPSPTAAVSVTVDNGARFKVGDQVRPGDSTEVMLVVAIAGNVLGVTRGYGGTTPAALADNMTLHILGNAAFEGDVRHSGEPNAGNSPIEFGNSPRARHRRRVGSALCGAIAAGGVSGLHRPVNGPLKGR